jgi:macrodomain Ter protein organizer (MatP/YcbG family)
MRNKQAKPARRSRGAAAATRNPSGTASKVSVTIDSAVLRQARVAAKRSGKTLSAHISQALERDLRRQRMAELVAGFEAAHGAITPEEVAGAIASWRG